MSLPNTPPRLLSSRGSFVNLVAGSTRSGDVSGASSPTEKSRMKAEEEVRQALLKAQESIEKAKKEEPGMPVGAPGRSASRSFRSATRIEILYLGSC